MRGGSGSGKTTLALRLKARFGEEEVRLIPHDSYYKRHDELPYEKRCLLNYDHPDAFDNDLLVHHLKELKAGRAIDCPIYDYSIHNRSDQVQHIEPAPVLIVEGILPFTEPELLALFDYKIFVDTDADERILRRILRDVKERGRSLDSVITQYRTTVKPMHEAFVEPSKRNADIIVPNGGENGPALEMLVHHIRSLISKPRPSEGWAPGPGPASRRPRTTQNQRLPTGRRQGVTYEPEQKDSARSPDGGHPDRMLCDARYGSRQRHYGGPGEHHAAAHVPVGDADPLLPCPVRRRDVLIR